MKTSIGPIKTQIRLFISLVSSEYMSHDFAKPTHECDHSKDSGHPGHLYSLIKVFAVSSVVN